MLRLIYNTKYGFKDLYIVQENIEDTIIEGQAEMEFEDEENSDIRQKCFYEKYKDNPEQILEDYPDIYDIIDEITRTDPYYMNFFCDILNDNPDKELCPDYFEIENIRIRYIPEKAA